MAERGKFISFEGGEGCGKTTQIKRLVEVLRSRGLDVVQTREMGGTPSAELLRPIVQSGASDRWDSICEALLFFAARRDHTKKLILPSLAAGKWVLSDRFFDTTWVFQGSAQGVPAETLKQIQTIAIGDVKPDLTIILDFDPAKGLQRAFTDAQSRTEENTRFERKGIDFHIKVRMGYLDIAKRDKERCVLVDANGSIEEVEARVQKVMRDRFGVL